MKFLMLMIPRVYQPDTPAEEKAGPDFAPEAADIEEMGRFNDELAKAGKIIDIDGLHPLEKGARVSFSGGQPIVTDGPFIETREVIGGYWIVELASKEEAVSWARRCPARDGDVIEIRPIYEFPDADQSA